MKQKIICLGDSLTYGYPYGPQASWVAYAVRQTGIVLINAGVNGNTLGDMAARFDHDVLKKKPAAVIILGGTNDAFREEVTLPMTIGAMEQMMMKALADNVMTVIGIPVPVDETRVNAKLERICLGMRALASRYELLVIDFWAPFIDKTTGRIREEFYIDGAHPNHEGYRAMGETAADFLTTSLLPCLEKAVPGKVVE
jgi:lysophospholipase L1-like esterase